MFIRVKRSVHEYGTYEYLQIVKSVREGASVRQKVLVTLGRVDEVIASGTLDGLTRSLARFSDRLRVIEAGRDDSMWARTARVRSYHSGRSASGNSGPSRRPNVKSPTRPAREQAEAEKGDDHHDQAARSAGPAGREGGRSPER
jgi:hypothetical protein